MTGDFTIEGWFNPDSWPTYAGFWGLGQYNDPGGIFFGVVGSTGKLDMQKANNTGGGYSTPFSQDAPPLGQWTHVALVRSGSTITVYYNGTAKGSWTDSTDWGTSTNKWFNIASVRNGSGNNVDFFNGKVSNFRVVKGTAVYTSSFRPSTEPLTNITNTKLLCCNDSSTTGSTVTPGTITAVSSPTASISTPFFDPNSFIFGETMDQSMVQCGEYVGDSSSDAWGSMRVHLGWEPDWCLVKDTSNTGNRWRLFCSQNRWGRAPGSAGYTNILYPDRSQSQDDNGNVSFPYEDGFAYTNGDGGFNGAGIRYIYIAIRRPDGRVTRPPEAGTELFQTNLGSAGNPNYKNNPTYPYFRVDFTWQRIPSNSDGALMGSRITLDNYWNCLLYTSPSPRDRG